jgi:hypothetical protein
MTAVDILDKIKWVQLERWVEKRVARRMAAG